MLQKTLFLAFVIAVACFSAAAAQVLDEAESAKVLSLPWNAGTRALPDSHATFVVPPHARMVEGANAARVERMMNGTSGNDTEAVMMLADGFAYFTYDKTGYVSFANGSDVDPAGLLAKIRAGTRRANAESIAHGRPMLTIDGWAQPPVLDRELGAVMSILKLHFNGGKQLYNTTALVFGRRGFEHIDLATNAENDARQIAALRDIVARFHFAKGDAYVDYVAGDPTATDGIASVVGGLAGH